MVSVKTKSALIADIDGLVGPSATSSTPTKTVTPSATSWPTAARHACEAAVRELPTLSMHLLAGIDEGPLSLVKLAARSGQLKGTVSKHVQRLVEAGLVERTPIPGNRKEIT